MTIIISFCALFIVITTTVEGSCLQYLSGQQCADIQNAGQKLAYSLGKLDSVIQDAIYRCIEEAHLITESSLKYLKTEASKVHIDFKGTTLIETHATNQAIINVNIIARHKLHAANQLFWDLLKRLSKQHMKDDTVVVALLEYKKRGKRDAASMNSINGLIDASESEIRQILQDVDNVMKNAAGKLFNIFADSLKTILNGKLPVDIDKMKTKLEDYLTDSIKVSIDSSTKRAKVLLMDSISELEKIDTVVSAFKKDPVHLSHALEPARALVLEILEETQKASLKKEIDEEIRKSVNLLKKYYYGIKNNKAIS